MWSNLYEFDKEKSEVLQMLCRMYVVYDYVAQTSGPIFEARNDGVALRNFAEYLSKVPDLYREEQELFCVGQINHDNQVIDTWPFQTIKAHVNTETDDVI